MDGENATTKRKFPKDLAGLRFGKLVAQRRGDDYVSPKGCVLQRWECQCDCGGNRTCLRGTLLRGEATNCGCTARYDDITGLRCHSLVAERLHESRKGGHAQWVCRCDCGSSVIVLASILKSGGKLSCGCVPHPRTTHGGDGTREYSSWQHMLQRCFNPNNKKWRLYGGRGITVCAQWRRSFSQFLTDVGECPSSRHTLDRHPNRDGNYEPGNVRWATPREQASNTSRTRFMEYDGRVQSRTEWSRELNISDSCIKKYANRGYTLKEIVAIVSGNTRSNRYGNSGLTDDTRHSECAAEAVE